MEQKPERDHNFFYLHDANQKKKRNGKLHKEKNKTVHF